MNIHRRWIARRLLDSPIIDRRTDDSIGENIQGPSLIKVPDWIDNALGRYYLYFADHKGTYIRLAFADALKGPWKVYVPGSLHLRDSRFPTKDVEPSMEAGTDRKSSISSMQLPHSVRKERSTAHIASPDVHVDELNKRIVLYFHGLESWGYQATRVGFSNDGISFRVELEIISKPYLRVFRHRDVTYGFTMPGQFYRSRDGIADFEKGSLCFNSNMRHSALLVQEDTLHVFWTQVGDAPERIYVSNVDLSQPFEEWTESEPYELLRPETTWEGANAPNEPSIRSVAYGLVNQLRDPAIYVEDARVFLLYACGGESGIALAELEPES